MLGALIFGIAVASTIAGIVSVEDAQVVAVIGSPHERRARGGCGAGLVRGAQSELTGARDLPRRP
jgi:hypothetical protein